jgi:hypothetical protein
MSLPTIIVPGYLESGIAYCTSFKQLRLYKMTCGNGIIPIEAVHLKGAENFIA